MLTTLIATMLASAQPSTTCVAAAHRMMGFVLEEAKGTRHEGQIQKSIDDAGGIDKKLATVAAGMSSAQCAFLLAAPDSSVRALAISTLPERSGK